MESSGWWSSVTRVPLGRSRRRRAAVTLPKPATFAHRHVAPGQGGGGMAELGPGPHGGDVLGCFVAALEADELAQGGAAHDGVDRQSGVALEVGQRTPPWRHRRSRPPGRCRTPGCTGAAAIRPRRRPAAWGCAGRGSGHRGENRPRPGCSTSADRRCRRPGGPGDAGRPRRRPGSRGRRHPPRQSVRPPARRRTGVAECRGRPPRGRPTASGRATDTARFLRAAAPWAWPRSGGSPAPRP